MSDIYLSITETPAVVTLSQPVVSGVLASNVTVTNVVSVNVVTMPAITLQSTAPAVTTVAGSVAVTTMPAISISSVTVSNFPATQTVAGTVTVGAFSTSSLPPSTVTVANTVTINGTVTVSNATTASAVFVKICGELEGAGTNEPREILTDNAGMLYVRLAPSNARSADPVIYDPAAGTAYINVRQQAGTSITVGSSVTIGSLPAISGTVTANVWGANAINGGQIAVKLDDEGAVFVKPQTAFQIEKMPNGTLTTRFGTPTTASVAFATSCVTNSSRKYLLIQNVTTGSNVITVGIGFTPTTTQGIQLTAGAGITFESSYIPTGAVQILSSVTASNFTILEA